MSRGYFDYQDQAVLNDIEDKLDDVIKTSKDESSEIIKILKKTKDLTLQLKDLLYEVDSYLSGDYGESDLLEFAMEHKLIDLDLYPKLKELRIKQHHILVPSKYGNNEELLEEYRKRGEKVEPLYDEKLEGWYRVTYKEAVEDDLKKGDKNVSGEKESNT